MTAAHPKPWYRLREDELMKQRIRDLPLSIAGSFATPMIQKLYLELAQRGLVYRPPCFWADEWFCPVGVPAIGIPFFLAHPRLRRLEQKMILEVEGGTRPAFMKLIRHETGHAYAYAYNLHKKQEWRRLFGYSSEPYEDTYHAKPYSRSYVIHLDNWYAQSHPDEDFAETFAVWLTPGMNWRKRYRGWKAIEKLEYVDRVMKKIAGRSPQKRTRFNPSEYDGLGMKLSAYYQQKRRDYEDSYPDFYDADLKVLFTEKPEEKGDVKAAAYLKARHQRLVGVVSFWTKEKKYTIDQLMRDLTRRCRELNLSMRKGHKDTELEIASYITSLITTYLFTGKFKRTK